MRPAALLSAAVIVGAMSFATTAHGASVTLSPESPADGVQVQTTSAGARLGVAWASDLIGCRVGSTVFTRLVVESDNDSAYLLRDPISVRSTDSVLLHRSLPVDTDSVVTWYVQVSCLAENVGDPQIVVTTPPRTFTLLAPDQRPRLHGRYNMFIGGRTVQRGQRRTLSGSSAWTVRSACAVGPCHVRANIRGVGNVILRYNARKRLWAGRLAGAKVGRMFICRSTLGGNRLRGAYTGALVIKLRNKSGAGTTRVVGAQTRAMRPQGTIRGKIIPNARGKARGCPAGTVTGTLKGFGR